MNSNNYCEKIISLCTQMIDDPNEQDFVRRVIQDNKRYDELYKINDKLIDDKIVFQQVYASLLKHKDDRVRMWSVISCLENNINVKEAKRTSQRLKWFSKSPLIRLASEQIVKEWKTGTLHIKK